MTSRTIHIEENNITIGRYVRYAMSAYLKKWWLAYAAPLAVCLCLSVENVNFLFVAIVLLFLVFTMIFFMVVVYYGLVPESRYSILPKEITLCDEGIGLKMRKKTVNDTAEAESEAEKFIIEETTLLWSMIKCVTAKDECLLLMFKSPKFSFLAIPYTAFKDETQLREAITLIRSKIA